MDKQLLVDIIKRQAGSLWKATIEGIMNAIDAGAATCDVELSRDMLIIRDTGKGFRSRKDVEDFFEVFGKPHDAREQKTYGRFRMGRGQLFAFGRNTWRSGTFEMTIDVEKDGLDYHLHDGLDRHDGCTITVEMYKQLTHTVYARMLEEIKDNAKYVRVPLTLNGKTFAVDTSRITWDLELPEADIRFKTNQDLRVYNQGIKVLSYYRYKYGVGGDIVTKKPIKVNFARNDIMDDCPVWTVIRKAIEAKANAEQTNRRSASRTTRNAGSNRTQAKRLTEADRVRLCNQLKDGELTPTQFKSARLFQRVNSGVNLTVRQVANRANGKVTAPPAEARPWKIREKVKQIDLNKMACVLQPSTLLRFGYVNPADLVDLANSVLPTNDRYKLSYVPWKALIASMASESQPVPDEQLNKLESVVVAVLRANSANLLRWCRDLFEDQAKQVSSQTRRVVLGRGPHDSWTDGASYIAINRTLVRRAGVCANAWFRYAAILMHEALHHVRTDKPHAHSKPFYERYHDWVSLDWALEPFISDCITSTPRIARSVGHRLNAAQLGEIDRLEAGQAFVASQEELNVVEVPPSNTQILPRHGEHESNAHS